MSHGTAIVFTIISYHLPCLRVCVKALWGALFFTGGFFSRDRSLLITVQAVLDKTGEPIMLLAIRRCKEDDGDDDDDEQ